MNAIAAGTTHESGAWMSKVSLRPQDLDDKSLEEMRRRNLGRLLDEVHVGFDRLALSFLHEAGYPEMTAAHTHVLRTMRMEGDSITRMAERAGISKQAMSKLVAAFEKDGLIEWRPIEGGIARQVHATEKGRQLLATGLGALRKAEAHYFHALSDDERETLRDLLLRAARSAESGSERPAAWRRRRA